MPAPRQRDEGLLSELLFTLNQARAQVRACRSVNATTTSRQAKRQRYVELVEAMEAYAAAATASGVPLSYRYHDEMRLSRSMAADPRERPSAPALRAQDRPQG